MIGATVTCKQEAVVRIHLSRGANVGHRCAVRTVRLNRLMDNSCDKNRNTFLDTTKVSKNLRVELSMYYSVIRQNL